MVRILTLGRAASSVAYLTPRQVRGARRLLDWSMPDLARVARVSISVVQRMETDTPQSIPDEAYVDVRRALEGAGVVFLPASGEAGSVWLDRG